MHGAVPFSLPELSGLPHPVERYLRTVLRPGQLPIEVAHVTQRGEILLRPEPDGWRPFEATARYTATPPGFLWEAHVRLGPGLRVSAHDRLVDGRASMRASVLGLITLASAHHSPPLAVGALQRWLGEAVLLPTALLPRGGVVWSPLGERSARAEIAVPGARAWLDFEFGPDGLVREVFSPERPRAVGDRFVPTPWRGRWTDYVETAGLLIPRRGEVEWLLAGGPMPYWRARIEDARYESAPHALTA